MYVLFALRKGPMSKLRIQQYQVKTPEQGSNEDNIESVLKDTRLCHIKEHKTE